MVSLFSPKLPHLLLQLRCSESDNKGKFNTITPYSKKFDEKEQVKHLFSRKSLSLKFLFANCTSSRCGTLSSMSSSAHSDQSDSENGPLAAEADCHKVEFNRVNCLAWVLHESARSFSLEVESLELAGSGAELAMGRMCICGINALLISLAHKTNLVRECIEIQLNMRHSELVQWFRVMELPRIAGFFIPLLKKWSMEYAGSYKFSLNTMIFIGVAGIIVAISCCAAVEKLGSECISCPLFTLSVEDTLVELLDLSHSLVSVDKLHQLATEAGFELDFLSHFGTKVLPSENIEELEFWIGLAQKNLSVAFQKEMVISDMKTIDTMVVTEEIGWLDFYAAFPCISNQERRGKQHAIQAEKEIIQSTVFTVCYDVFSGFAYFSHSTQKHLDAELLAFLIRRPGALDFSQSLLTICLEDYWAAYDKSGGLFVAGASDHIPSTKGTTRFPVALEAQQKPTDLMEQECQRNKSRCWSKMNKASSTADTDAVVFVEGTSTSKSNLVHESLIRKYSIKLISSSVEVWMGTQLLFIDVMVSLELLLKQLHGHKVTARERKKLKRTLNDIALLIPVTILLLIPVSAVGHAAMLAAINKYVPFLIPSPCSYERLDVVKQLKKTRKMEVQSWSNLDNPSSKVL